MIFAVDGSGGSNISAGYGLVIYDEDKQEVIAQGKGKIEPFEILGATLVADEYRLDIIYGTKAVKPTNNRGELCAIMCAIKIVKHWGLRDDQYKIVSDSKYSMTIFTEWYQEWERQGVFHLKLNMDIIAYMWNDYQMFNVCFIHQKAHKSLKEIARLNGTEKLYATLNRTADELAKQGRLMPSN